MKLRLPVPPGIFRVYYDWGGQIRMRKFGCGMLFYLDFEVDSDISARFFLINSVCHSLLYD